MNTTNLKANFKTADLLTTENLLTKDILSTDSHIGDSLQKPLLTASSQSAPLTFTEEFSGTVSTTVSNSEFTNLKSNNLQPQAAFDETPIVVNFVDGGIEKQVAIPVVNDDVNGNSRTVNLPLDDFTSAANFGSHSFAASEVLPQSNVKGFDTVETQNVNNREVNILSVGDDAGYVQDTSLSNQFTSDATVDNLSSLSQSQSEYLDPAVLPVQGTVTGGSEEGVLLNSELKNNPSVRNIGFKEINNPADAEQTWVIVHGWNDTPDGRFTELAEEITASHSGDRVLLLDWREAAYNSSETFGIEYGAPGDGNFRAATWINPVAEFAVAALNDYYGIDSEQASQGLNLIGHSLGSLVSAEMGRIYRDGLTVENETILTGNDEGARTITALDPPSARNGDENPFTVDPLEDIYDTDGRIDGIQAPTTYADASVFSRAYVGEMSIAGNKELALGADEAFEMTFGTQSELMDFGSEHDRVVRAFTHTINQEGIIGDLLGIRAYDSIETLPIDDLGELKIIEGNDHGFKGIVNVSEENLVTSLTGVLKAGNQDDIVIGSYSNEEMHGTDLLNFGTNSSYAGDHNDIFFGESGNDIILGDNNDDILIGGIGRDILNGGAGMDTFIFQSGDGSAIESDTNLIEDFEIGIDKIGLSDMSFEDLTFQQSSNGTAIMSGSEIIALLQNIQVEDIQNPEYFVNVAQNQFSIG